MAKGEYTAIIKTMKKYYVYMLRRPDKRDPYNPMLNQPFYVGKGCYDRIKYHRREVSRYLRGTKKYVDNARKTEIIISLWERELDFQEDIYKTGLTQGEALTLEYSLIKYYKSEKTGGCLCNTLHDAPGPSEKTCEKLSLAHKRFSNIEYCLACGRIFEVRKRKDKKFCTFKCSILHRGLFSEIKWCEECGVLIRKRKGMKNWATRTLCNKCLARTQIYKLLYNAEFQYKAVLGQLGKTKAHKGRQLTEERKKQLSEAAKQHPKRKEKCYRDYLGYVEIKFCCKCGKCFGRERHEKESAWERHSFCGKDCRYTSGVKRVCVR